jgi:hypothetical protein
LTEAQYITFILGFAATITTVLLAILLNNARLTDVKEALRAEIRAEVSTLRTEMKTDMSTLRIDLKADVASSQQTITGHLLDIISKLAELDNRLTRLAR